MFGFPHHIQAFPEPHLRALVRSPELVVRTWRSVIAEGAEITERDVMDALDTVIEELRAIEHDKERNTA